ncbi:hypothetical protein A464_4550 [Salmonella bongori N268-08]|uniref:Uncharacterized protein n=1 Tax=Salmonella bongori N268-08 TaxID=1197719 RepID=S5NNC7_SALBN|nr:hypothetical protein A464_4550 [Salmonella bongori N268-08]
MASLNIIGIALTNRTGREQNEHDFKAFFTGDNVDVNRNNAWICNGGRSNNDG